MTDRTAVTEEENEALRRVPELVETAITSLPMMQLGDGSFGQPDQAGSDRGGIRYSARQTAIVLLGLLRAEEFGIEHPFHTGGLRARLLGDAGRTRVGAGSLGLILWAESRLEGDATEELLGLLAEELGVDGPGATRGSELAWLLTALAEVAARERLGAEGASLAEEARAEVIARRRPETGLFQGPGHGPRRRFASFEAQIQIVSALAQLHRLRDDAEAGEAAVAAADSLIAVQRPDGGWPAVIDVRRGTAVEVHPLSTVNQAALAPMAMGAVGVITGDPTYWRTALRGLPWLWGRNELGVAMADPEAGTIYRAIARGEKVERARLMARAASSFIRSPTGRETPEDLRVDREPTPADLGWLLEAWAGARSRGALSP